MHKFTLFTILLSIITISIVIDIVVNGYSLSSDYVPEKEEVIVEKMQSEDKENSTVEPAETETTTDDSVDLYSFTEIETFDEVLLKNIGIERGIVKEAPQDKLYLQAIHLPKEAKNRIKIVNLFDFEEYLGTMYALQFQDTDEAEKFYSDLKVKSLTIAGANIRETDTFGDASFYFNQIGKTKTAFSTVRIGSSVYGFEYPHKSHQIFKDLSKELSDNQDK